MRKMNELAGYFPFAPLFADDGLPQQSPPDQGQMENARQINSDAGHVVNPTIETDIALADEAVEQKERPQIAREVVTIEEVETNIEEGNLNTGVADEPDEEPMDQDPPFVPQRSTQIAEKAAAQAALQATRDEPEMHRLLHFSMAGNPGA